MGEAGRDALRVGFDRTVKLESHGATVSSDAGLFPYRKLDDAVHLTESAAAEFFDFRTGRRQTVWAFLDVAGEAIHCHSNGPVVGPGEGQMGSVESGNVQ